MVAMSVPVTPSPSKGDLLAAGDLVAGRYHVEGLIGRGGMGEVYAARDVSAEDRVALKLIHPELLGSSKTRSRFEREVELTRRIDHPNVLKVRDFLKVEPPGHENAQVPCLVMEFLEGPTLADHLNERKVPMASDEARPIVCQIAAALSAAHRSGVVHRDLKPDNVFLVPDRKTGALRAVLTDFGVARADRARPSGGSGKSADDSQTFTASNVLIGTPDYMAPEQLELEKAGPLSDLYSLGLVFFEMVTGRLPFQSKNRLEAVFQRVKEPAPSPRSINPAVDEDCDRVIQRCLQREPGDRYTNAQEIIRELDGDQSGWLSRDPALDRRRMAAIATGVVLLLLVIALVAIYAT
jgi:eukaryotic-like serine/threonine-protein kinase